MYDRKLECCEWVSGKCYVRCVRVGSVKKVIEELPVETSYVLLIHPNPGAVLGVYERVGVAAIRRSWVRKDHENRVQIV